MVTRRVAHQHCAYLRRRSLEPGGAEWRLTELRLCERYKLVEVVESGRGAASGVVGCKEQRRESSGSRGTGKRFGELKEKGKTEKEGQSNFL